MNTLVPADLRRALSRRAHRRVLDRQRVSAHAGRRRRLARDRSRSARSASTRRRASAASASSSCSPSDTARASPSCGSTTRSIFATACSSTSRLRVWRGEPVAVDMGYVNVIWQGDANRIALECLARAASPPFVVNVTGARDASRARARRALRRALGNDAAIHRHRARRRAAQQHVAHAARRSRRRRCQHRRR